MTRRRDECEDNVDEDQDDAIDEDDEDYGSSSGGRGGGGSKRKRSYFIDDVAEEDEDEEDEYDEDDENYGVGGGNYRRGKKSAKKASGADFFELEADVDTDGEEEEEEDGEDDFIVNERVDQDEEEDARRMHHRPLLSLEDDQEDVEALEKIIQEKFSRNRTESSDDDDDDGTEVEQQALLPSVTDPKLWLVKCAIGHEKEVAVCLMQKCIDKDSELQIRSVIALDHLKNYIYIEADKEAHVKQACKGMRNIYTWSKILMVPIKEMTDVLSVESKAIDLARDTLVRMKIGTYKGDIAKVVDVDNVRQRVTVKLIPRIDLQALANKLEGREVPKKKTFTPPPRILNVDEARELNIRVERRRDRNFGGYFEKINGMMFKDGFLYKTVSIKSISTQNIQPTFDELEKLRQPNENGDGDIANLSSLFTNGKKGRFMKGDRVIVIKGDLINMEGSVEKVEEDIVHIKPIEPYATGLPKTLAVSEKQLSKYFETGNHVKVVSGAHEGVTGMVLKVKGHFVNIMSDTTKEELQVFSENVVASSEVTSGVTKNGDFHMKHGGFICAKSQSYVLVGGSRANGDRKVNQLASRVAQLKTPTRLPNSAGTSQRGGPPLPGGWRNRGGRGGKDCSVKIWVGPFKGYKGRVVDVHGTSVRVELESQMKVVTVDCTHISDNVDLTTPYGDTHSRYGCGSETPMHPSRTPLHPFMTPIRDSAATPIHDGMRTPMRDRAWNPYAQISPPRMVHVE